MRKVIFLLSLVFICSTQAKDSSPKRDVAQEPSPAFQFNEKKIFNKFSEITSDFLTRIAELSKMKKSCLQTEDEKSCCRKAYFHYGSLLENIEGYYKQNLKLVELENESDRALSFQKNLLVEMSISMHERLHNICELSSAPEQVNRNKKAPKISQKMTPSAREAEISKIKDSIRNLLFKENKDENFIDNDGVARSQKVNNDYSSSIGETVFKALELFQ